MTWKLTFVVLASLNKLLNKQLICLRSELHYAADIGKSTGPRSLTGENSGGPMKTLIVPVLLSGNKIAVGSPSRGILIYIEKKLGLVKVLEDQ